MSPIECLLAGAINLHPMKELTFRPMMQQQLIIIPRGRQLLESPKPLMGKRNKVTIHRNPNKGNAN